MANNWKITADLEHMVRERDQTGVYCRTDMLAAVPRGQSLKRVASCEHIVNDLALVTPENIVLACMSCNASKGQKLLAAWLQSSYCRMRRIDASTVATS